MILRISGLSVILIAALAGPVIAQNPPEPVGDAGFFGEREVLAGDPVAPGADEPARAADAAAVGSPDQTSPEVPVVGKPSSDDIDLGSLGLDPASLAFDDKLNLYGFADFTFLLQHWLQNPMAPPNARTFQSGSLNIYLAKNLTAKARMLAEVRFTFMPNGTMNPDGSFIETSAQDLVNFSRITNWGGIVIERAYAEYDLTEHVTIRGGHWLTPYGIWNIDHGSPAIIGTHRPYIIGEQFFPEHQTGLDLFGSHYLDRFKVEAHLTASNGRGATEAQIDQDNKLAFGGSVRVATPWGLTLGGSYYRGRYTGLAPGFGMPAPTYREAAYGGDVQFDRGALHIQAELIARDRHFGSGQFSTATGGGTDARDLGAYAIAGYRFDQLWNVMPYFYYENYQPSDHSLFAKVNAGNLGLNFRPAANLVFKLQGTYVEFGDDPALLAGQKLILFAAQTSWVF